MEVKLDDVTGGRTKTNMQHGVTLPSDTIFDKMTGEVIKPKGLHVVTPSKAAAGALASHANSLAASAPTVGKTSRPQQVKVSQDPAPMRSRPVKSLQASLPPAQRQTAEIPPFHAESGQSVPALTKGLKRTSEQAFPATTTSATYKVPPQSMHFLNPEAPTESAKETPTALVNVVDTPQHMPPSTKSPFLYEEEPTESYHEFRRKNQWWAEMARADKARKEAQDPNAKLEGPMIPKPNQSEGTITDSDR